MSETAPALRFHHLGLAVRQPRPTLAFLRTLGYQIGPTVCDELQRVDLVFCRSATMPAVEVVLRARADSPSDAILQRTAAQIYHVCYEVDDFEDALGRLRSEGHRPHCVVPRMPAVLFGGRLVSFHYVGGFGLVELLEP